MLYHSMNLRNDFQETNYHIALNCTETTISRVTGFFFISSKLFVAIFEPLGEMLKKRNPGAVAKCSLRSDKIYCH